MPHEVCATFVWQERAHTRATQMTHMPSLKPLSLLCQHRGELIASLTRHLIVTEKRYPTLSANRGLRDKIQGRSRYRKSFVHRVYSAQNGTDTMVSESEWARPWGRVDPSFLRYTTPCCSKCSEGQWAWVEEAVPYCGRIASQARQAQESVAAGAAEDDEQVQEGDEVRACTAHLTTLLLVLAAPHASVPSRFLS